MIKVKPSANWLQEGDVVFEWKILGPAFSIGRIPSSNARIWMFVVKCSCGLISTTSRNMLKAKESKACKDCARKASIGNWKHGESGTRLAQCYWNMIARCCYLESKDYSAYGGRGITVCEEWKKNNRSFYLWARANGYRDDLELDRINNDLGYSPTNCQWLTEEEHKRKHAA